MHNYPYTEHFLGIGHDTEGATCIGVAHATLLCLVVRAVKLALVTRPYSLDMILGVAIV